MNSDFDTDGFIGFILLDVDAQKGEARPRLELNLSFRGEADPTLVLPDSNLPIGLLYWRQEGFEVKTVWPPRQQCR